MPGFKVQICRSEWKKIRNGIVGQILKQNPVLSREKALSIADREMFAKFIRGPRPRASTTAMARMPNETTLIDNKNLKLQAWDRKRARLATQILQRNPTMTNATAAAMAREQAGPPPR